MEAQQAEAADKPGQTRKKISAEEAAVLRERETLRLARQRILQQLAQSTNARHRRLLEDALMALDRKISG